MLKNRIVNIIFFLTIFVVIVADVFMHVSLWIYLFVVILYSLVQAYGSIVLSAGFFVPVKFVGTSDQPHIAITFDDGPVPGKTEKVLSILKSYQVPAAFFCIGNRIQQHQGIVKQIYADGHVLGNHSFWHGKLFDLQPASKIADELTETDNAIQDAIGVKPKFFRPPYGVTNPMVASAIRAGQYKTIGWSIRSFDTTTKDGNQLFKRVTASIKAGDIFLFHDYCDSTIEILPAFLEFVKKNGLKIVRVDELLGEQAYA